MSRFNMIAESEVSTVLAEYKPEDKKYTAYQSEAELERELIQNLQEQGYEYLQIHNAHDLEDNLRIQLQKLNNYVFSDSEWQRFFYENIVGNSEGVVEKTRKIQEKDTAISFRAEDGHTQNIRLLDKKNIHSASFRSGISAVRRFPRLRHSTGSRGWRSLCSACSSPIGRTQRPDAE